jgi:hypothetical protein
MITTSGWKINHYGSAHPNPTLKECQYSLRKFKRSIKEDLAGIDNNQDSDRYWANNLAHDIRIYESLLVSYISRFGRKRRRSKEFVRFRKYYRQAIRERKAAGLLN